jgi:hypothetical protein
MQQREAEAQKLQEAFGRGLKLEELRVRPETSVPYGDQWAM